MPARVGVLERHVPATGIASEEIGATALLSTIAWVGVVVGSVRVYACIAALPLLTMRLVDQRR